MKYWVLFYNVYFTTDKQIIELREKKTIGVWYSVIISMLPPTDNADNFNNFCFIP